MYSIYQLNTHNTGTKLVNISMLVMKSRKEGLLTAQVPATQSPAQQRGEGQLQSSARMPVARARRGRRTVVKRILLVYVEIVGCEMELMYKCCGRWDDVRNGTEEGHKCGTYSLPKAALGTMGIW